MTEHDLHAAQVGAVFQQMGGKGVPERVGRDVFADARLHSSFFYHVPECLACHSVPEPAQEQIFAFVLSSGLDPCREPDILTAPLWPIRRSGPAVPFPFAHRQKISGIQIHIPDFQRYQFRNPQSSGIEKLQHGPVADLVHRLSPVRPKAFPLLVPERMTGSLLKVSGRLDDRGRITVAVVLDDQEAVKHSSSPTGPGPGCGAKSLRLSELGKDAKSHPEP